MFAESSLLGGYVDNPYQSSVAEKEEPVPVSLVGSMLAGLSGCLVVGNYVTATSGRWDWSNTFDYAIFVGWPLAMAMHISLMRRSSNRLALAACTMACVMLGSFALSWLGWFSVNPYEQFMASQTYFGASGWVRWTCLVCVGLLPWLYLWSQGAVVRSVVAVSVLLAHSLNAALVWMSCHVPID